MPKTKLFIAIPSTGTVCDGIPFLLRSLEKTYSDRIEFIYPKECVRRIFHDYARNMLVEEFLESGADILWFLDSDVLPPTNILDLITEHGPAWDAAGAPYPVFMTPTGATSPQVVFTVYKKVEDKLIHDVIPHSGHNFVDGVATGCIFVRRSVFDKLSKPYFEFKFNAETRNLIEGEDLGFCKKLSALNIQFFIDYSLVCNHFKEVGLLHVNNYAIEYSNKSVMAYDESIKGQVTALVSQLSKKPSQPKSTLILPSHLA